MAKKIALMAILIALAVSISWLERIIPLQSPVPGIRLGLSNIVTLVALYKFGIKAGVAVTVIRVLLTGALFGGVSAILYGMSGAALSLAVMILLKKTKKPTVIGVSAAGGVFHNAGQLLAASLAVNNFGLFSYMPLLSLSGTAAGAITGFLALLALKKLESVKFQ